MRPRHLLVLALLAATVAAGCVDRSVRRDAITEYLNAGYEDRAVGCPFPVAEEAEEGIAGLSGAHGFAVAPSGVVHVAYADRLETVTRSWHQGATEPLDGAAEATRIAAGPDAVAVARTLGANRTLTAFDPDLEPVANRTLPSPPGGLAVDADGTILVVDAPDGDDPRLTRYDRELVPQGEVDLVGLDGPVRDLAVCGDRLFAAVGSPSGGHVAVLEADGTPVARDAPGPAERVGVGHELVFAAGQREALRQLTVTTVDGTQLLQLNNTQDRPYGTFRVAHGLVYNLRQDALLARPIPDFLTRPS